MTSQSMLKIGRLRLKLKGQICGDGVLQNMLQLFNIFVCFQSAVRILYPHDTVIVPMMELKPKFHFFELIMKIVILTNLSRTETDRQRCRH